MNHTIKFLILSSLVLYSFSSCQDFLTETNPNEIQQSEYYNNLSETESALTAVYSTLRASSLMNIQAEAYRSDMAWPGYGRPIPDSESYTKWYYHNYDNSTQEICEKWQILYRGLFRANQVIDGLKKLKNQGRITTSSQIRQWNEQMGQALFFRGLFHHYLALSFRHDNGKCAIIFDKVPKTFEDFHGPLSTAEEVIAFARKDLKEAYSLLPAKYGNNTISKGEGRVTRATAATIIGNSYLLNTTRDNPDFSQSIDSAMVYYNDVITNPDYDLHLVKDLNLINTYAGEFNSESIFEISYSKNHNSEINIWDENTMVSKMGFYIQYMGLPAWLICAYSSEPMDPLDIRNYYDSIPNIKQPNEKFRRPRLVPLRCSSMIAVVNDVHTRFFDEPITTKSLICQREGFGFGFFRHYSEWDISDGKQGEWRTGKNFVVNKLSEVVLNYAECLIYKNRIQDAIYYINQIRRRWGLVSLGQNDNSGVYTFDNILYTQESLLEQLMYVDKPLETSIEGYETRWLDLRRWGIIEKRFKSLANKTFYVGSFLYNYQGEIINRWNALVSSRRFEGVDYTDTSADPFIGRSIINYEYDKTSSRIDIEKIKYNFYYPIPLSEIQNNKHIND